MATKAATYYGTETCYPENLFGTEPVPERNQPFWNAIRGTMESGGIYPSETPKVSVFWKVMKD
jgi:hypothetical protein